MPPKRKTKTESSKKPSDRDENKENAPQNKVHNVKDDEIARLQEQVRLLTIENETLRKHMEKKKPNAAPATPKPRIRLSTTSSTPGTKQRRDSVQSVKPKDKGCSCSGNCGNKKCGCVKKDLGCTPACKCSDDCMNQAEDSDEDKENEEENVAVPKTNKQKLVIPKSNANLSPVSSPSSNSRSLTKSPSDDGRKGSANNSYNSNASTQTDDEEHLMNPMKPRRQLARSPLPNLKKSPGPADTTVSHDDVFLPVREVEKEEAEVLEPPEELNEPEVDWDKHQAQLIKCQKCGRKFYPFRLNIHEKSCKNL